MIAKKSFGQHFLHDHRVIEKIIAAAEITPGETVIEVGPGHGVLTKALVEAGAKVIAIEADRDLITELEVKFPQAKIIFSDVLKVDISDLSRISNFAFRNYKVVANLPYNIASAVIEKFFTAPIPPSEMIVMVQKEVADRILAAPGEMSVLSVACQLYADVSRVTNVAPGAFSPPPKVESAVIRLETKKRRIKNEEIIQLAKVGFSSRRKQLHGNLAAAQVASSEEVKRSLQALGLAATARAQELSVDNWAQLFEKLR